jgi:hypothetical protein
MRISVALCALVLLSVAAICQPAAGKPPMTPTGFKVVASMKDPATRLWVMAGGGSYGAAKSEFTARYQQKGWEIGLRDANNPDDPGVIARSADGKTCVALSDWETERLALINVDGLSRSDADKADAQPAALVMRSGTCGWYFTASFPSG